MSVSGITEQLGSIANIVGTPPYVDNAIAAISEVISELGAEIKNELGCLGTQVYSVAKAVNQK